MEREINGRKVTFSGTDPHYSHILFTCPDCGTYTFLTIAGGELNECPEDCPNHKYKKPFPDFEMRYFAEVENEPRRLSEVSWNDATGEPDADGFYRRKRWTAGTTEDVRELFIPGKGWVAA